MTETTTARRDPATKVYTGIGSRETPEPACRTMTAVARELGRGGWTVRSGHADGADKAFEKGADEVRGAKEIYIPWRGFDGSDSPLHVAPKGAEAIAESFHPAWERCTQAARKLHTRNVCQVLGRDLATPTRVVIAWTTGGRLVGGTATALRMAIHYRIPIVNLGDPRWARASVEQVLAYVRAVAADGEARDEAIADLPSAEPPKAAAGTSGASGGGRGAAPKGAAKDAPSAQGSFTFGDTSRFR